MVENCLLCEIDDPHACDVCKLGMRLGFDQKLCVPESDCDAALVTCPCPIDRIFKDGECKKCEA